MKVPGPDGTEIETTLESGVVMPEWKAASCVFCSDDQRRFIAQIPLTDEELQAHAQHPATFFGVIDRNAGRSGMRTGLDLFNCLLETYSRSPREKLIEFMVHAPDIERLRTMTQEDLATEYCTRLASSIMQRETENAVSVAALKPSSP